MPEELVNPKEKLYFAIALTFSILVYIGLLISLVGLVYIPIGIVAFAFAQGVALGQIRGNSVRVSPEQFPDLYAISERLAAQMGLAAAPSLYVVQDGSYLNAFASAFFGRNFMIVYSAVYELAREQGEAELAFVVAHEMAHLKRRHTLKKAITFPATFFPFLAPAYARACEYTADGFGTFCEPAGAINGILILAAGKKLYRSVDGNAFIAQTQTDTDFFVWLAEKLADHPTLPNRLLAIARQLQTTQSPTTALEAGAAIATA